MPTPDKQHLRMDPQNDVGWERVKNINRHCSRVMPYYWYLLFV